MNRFILNLRSVDKHETSISRVGNIGSDLHFHNPDADDDTWPEVLEEVEAGAQDEAQMEIVLEERDTNEAVRLT